MKFLFYKNKKEKKCNIKTTSLKKNIISACLICLFFVIYSYCSLILKKYMGDYYFKYLFFNFFLFFALASLFLILRSFFLKNRNLSYKYLDFSDKAVCVMDCENNLLFANKLYQKLCKDQKVEDIFELLGREKQFAQPLYRLKLKAQKTGSAHEDFLLEKSHFILDRLFLSKYKTPRWVSISARSNVPYSQDLIWQLEDSTESKFHYQKISKELCQIRKFSDESPFLFFVSDKKGKILFSNYIFREKFNISSQNSKNITLKDFLSPQDFQQILISLEKKEENISNYTRISVEDENQKVIFFDLYFHKNIKDPIFEKAIYFIAVPLQELNQFREDDFLNEMKLKDAFDNLPGSLALVNQNKEAIYLNEEFRSLLEIDQTPDLASKPFQLDDFLSQNSQEVISKNLKKIQDSSQEIVTFNIKLAKNTKKDIQFCIKSSKLQKSKNFPKFYFISAREITQQKVLEKKLDQNQKMQAVGQLAGGIAHDFNNVLAAITMSCDLLLNNHRSSDPSHPDLINIKNNADRAASLVQQLLAFSRQQTMELKSACLTDLLFDLKMMITRLIGPKIIFKIEHSPELQKVYIDQASMQRVIVNLAINARDAMPNGGELTIQLENVVNAQKKEYQKFNLSSENYVLLKLSDTGVGIDPELKDKIFEPFFTTKEVGKGSGLGLATAYGIIKQMEGAIFCESQKEIGTSFYIFLPVDESKNLPLVTKENVEKEKITSDLTGNATILIVEDEDIIRLGNKRALESRGYQVLEASSGVEALEILQENSSQIDLIVSDVVMPEMDGPTLLKKMQNLYPNLPFLFVSGYAQEAFSKNLPENVKFYFLAKPFSLKSFASKVKEILTENIK